MGYLGLFIHSGFVNGSVESVMEVTDKEILIFTTEDHLAQLHPLSRHHILFTIRSFIQHLQLICYHLDICYQHLSDIYYLAMLIIYDFMLIK